MFFYGPISILFWFLYFKVPESVGSKRFESVNERERAREREREVNFISTQKKNVESVNERERS